MKIRTVTLTKSNYSGQAARPVGTQLQGIWIRIYKGDTLVHESSTPENIRLTKTWEPPAPRPRFINGATSLTPPYTPR